MASLLVYGAFSWVRIIYVGFLVDLNGPLCVLGLLRSLVCAVPQQKRRYVF